MTYSAVCRAAGVGSSGRRYDTRDTELDVIYVNGDNNLEVLRRPDECWKVMLIENDFKSPMFDVEGV